MGTRPTVPPLQTRQLREAWQAANGMIHVDAGEAIRQLKRLHKGLSQDQTHRAISLAFNATLSKQRTFLRRHIQRKSPSSALRASGYGQGKGIAINRANRRKLYATLSVSSKAMPLRYYGAKPSNAGVSVEVTKGRRKTIAFAFIAKGKMPKANVMARATYQPNSGISLRKKRIRSKGPDLPITALVGPPVGKPDPNIWETVKERTALEVPKQLQRFFDKIATGKVK